MYTQRLNVSQLISYITFNLLIVNYFLPDLTKCSTEFLMDVAVKKKQHILRRTMCLKKVPGYPQLKVKNCYYDITGQIPEICDYLPNVVKGRLPPHDFFWTILYTLYHDNVETYIAQIE